MLVKVCCSTLLPRNLLEWDFTLVEEGGLGMRGYFCFRKLGETELSLGTVPLKTAGR